MRGLACILPCLHAPLQAQRQPQPLIDFVHERLISLTQVPNTSA